MKRKVDNLHEEDEKNGRDNRALGKPPFTDLGLEREPDVSVWFSIVMFFLIKNTVS